MQLNETEQKKVKKTIRRMAQVLKLAFGDKTDIYIGYYAFLTAQVFINKYLGECKNEDEFKSIKTFLLKDLSSFTKTTYAQQFNKGGDDVGHQ